MKALLVVALMAPLAACATMARGTTQDLAVETTPPGAKVEASNGKACEPTPCKLEKMKREGKFKLTFSMPGFQNQTVDITHATSTAGAAAIAASFAIPGGILWSLIDANFGASQDLKPSPVQVTLQPAGSAAAPAD